MDYGVTSMTAPLRRVAVRRPAAASDFARAHWAQPLDVDLLLDQHAAFVGILQRLGVDVVELPALEGLPDSCFTYDPVFTISDGVVTLRAAKDVRVGEGERLAADLAAAGVPTVATLTGEATADGGDMFWLDDTTLAVGRSYRTNALAVAQLSEILRPRGIRVEVYDVPHDQGPEWCLHLMRTSLSSTSDVRRLPCSRSYDDAAWSCCRFPKRTGSASAATCSRPLPALSSLPRAMMRPRRPSQRAGARFTSMPRARSARARAGRPASRARSGVPRTRRGVARRARRPPGPRRWAR